MKRKWSLVVVATMTVLGLLVACASPAAPPPTAAPAPTTAPAAAPTKPAAVATAAPTAAAPAPAATKPAAAAPAATGSIKIGMVSGFSGAYAAFGQEQMRGIQLALDEVNGTVLGRKIEILQRDDKLSTQEAAVQSQQLIQNENVKFLMGCLSAATTLAMNEVAKRAEAVYMGTCQTNNLNKMPDFSPLTFHVALTPYFNTLAASPWIAQNLGKKWYFLMPDYAFGKEAHEGFTKAIKDLGITDLGITWTPLGTTDFNPHIPKIRQAKPDVLIAGVAGADTVNFIKQAKSFGLDKEMKLFNTIVDLPAEIELGYANVAGTYASAAFYWEAGDKIASTKKFVDAHAAKFQGAMPSSYTAYAYEAMRLIIDGINKAGSDDPKKVADALTGYKFDYDRGQQWLRKCDNQSIQPMFILKGRTAAEAAAVKRDQFGLREIVGVIDASDSNERTCAELGLANRQ